MKMGGKNKLQRFEENETFQRFYQPPFEDVFSKDFIFKGKWKKEVFNNDAPLVLELGCGKGEYTVGMAKKYKGKNFIGVDIKGARMWRGAKDVNEHNLLNAAFLRTRIEIIHRFFAKDEVDELWITFPDPQLKKRRAKKRLTSSVFLNNYKSFLKDNGCINLKTDNDVLYEYTLALARFNHLDVEVATDDLYGSGMEDEILSMKTFYEKGFLEQGMTINYLRFRLPSGKTIIELPDDE